MIGGLGNDTYFVDNVGDVITELSGQGTDTVFSTVNVAALWQNVENLTLSATALSVNGNFLNNILTGNSQKNTLNGGAGEDTLIGGLDSDTYIYNSAGDVIVENVDEGLNDLVIAYINVAALMANVENVTLAGTATSATGNELNNILTGNSLDNFLYGGLGNDQLNGGVGADTMTGGQGDDTYLVENLGDVVIEASGEGNDVIYTWVNIAALAANVERATIIGPGDLNITGNELNNRLYGNDNNNILIGLDGDDIIGGLAGNDTIIGGAGRDLLTGGAGADSFVYQAITDSGTTGATRDIIYDFTQGQDLIDLSAIDAITGGGDDAFNFIGNSAFSNTAGELRYDYQGGYTIISMDVNGDGIADSQITLVGNIPLILSDFGL
jgi:Ca2+-binding RTX toxin-like protein